MNCNKKNIILKIITPSLVISSIIIAIYILYFIYNNDCETAINSFMNVVYGIFASSFVVLIFEHKKASLDDIERHDNRIKSVGIILCRIKDYISLSNVEVEGMEPKLLINKLKVVNKKITMDILAKSVIFQMENELSIFLSNKLFFLTKSIFDDNEISKAEYLFNVVSKISTKIKNSKSNLEEISVELLNEELKSFLKLIGGISYE